MRMTRLHAPTLKETPKDAEVASHQLLVRGGFIRKLAAGIYDYLPLANRVLHKIERIVREELDAVGCQEVRLPMVQPAEIWEESGRWGFYGPELLRLKDRRGGEFCLGPTHEEVIVDLVRRDVRSWRALPLNLYQIQTKFRDEIRPRAGLMRGREFLMKDAYSFDVSEAAALESYDQMYAAYERIFARCGLDFRAVEADSGAIGGSRSHEFQVLAETGEDAMVACTHCGYAANIEQAEVPAPAAGEPASVPSVETVATPGKRSIEDVSAFLGLPAAKLVKTLIVEADDELYAVLLRGDHELNEIKLRKHLGAAVVSLADEKRVKQQTNAPIGFAGPVGLTGVKAIVADHAVAGLDGGVTGANLVDAHLANVQAGRDYQATFADLRFAQDGDACPRCSGELRAFRGIEVGHVFYLGTKYSDAMRCMFLDEEGKDTAMVMGCYGIGISRIMAAAIEQHHDDNGIRWPIALAPYTVAILPLQMNKDDVVQAAERLYETLRGAGVDVLLDDRKERAGSKFNDAELIGSPIIIAIGGRGLANGEVEVKLRATGEKRDVAIDQVSAFVAEHLR